MRPWSQSFNERLYWDKGGEGQQSEKRWRQNPPQSIPQKEIIISCSNDKTIKIWENKKEDEKSLDEIQDEKEIEQMKNFVNSFYQAVGDFEMQRTIAKENAIKGKKENEKKKRKSKKKKKMIYY